jgi:hypothetical protein
VQHLLDIEKVFKALAKANLKVSAQKCTWFAEELKLLGFIISGTTMKSDPKKIQAIEERKPPTNVKETQIFLGCCTYYRTLIKDFAKIAKPLYELLKKEVKFEWAREHQEAFETLKQKLKESPIVRLPVLDRQYRRFSIHRQLFVGTWMLSGLNRSRYQSRICSELW